MKLKTLMLVVIAGMVALGTLGQSPMKSLVIGATEDSYVVTDLADEADPQGFRQQNYGSLEFLKTWYAWGVVEDERLLSIDLVKFNLTEISDLDIESVSLQLFARQTNLTQAARLVDVHLVNGHWEESNVTYESRPVWDAVPLATAAIYGAGGWYSWNITESAKSALRSGEVSYAVALRSALAENEEQVLFVAKEALKRAPRIVVTYYAPTSEGLASVDWWWWVVIAGVVVVLLGVAFGMGSRLRRPSSPPMA